ncbi:MAG: hypothetical protein ACPHID_04965 [Thermoplasmatota archaeon]
MRWLITGILTTVAVALAAGLAIQLAMTGMPNPLLLSITVIAVSAAAAYPLATMEPQHLCASCHATSLGLGDFGFCLRCGATARYERSS